MSYKAVYNNCDDPPLLDTGFGIGNSWLLNNASQRCATTNVYMGKGSYTLTSCNLGCMLRLPQNTNITDIKFVIRNTSGSNNYVWGVSDDLSISATTLVSGTLSTTYTTTSWSGSVTSSGIFITTSSSASIYVDEVSVTTTQNPYSLLAVQGPAGPTGATGATGPQGDQGLTGPQGATGSQGIPGIQGVQGATGSQGVPGINGTDGILTVSGTGQILVAQAGTTTTDIVDLNRDIAFGLGLCIITLFGLAYFFSKK